MSSEVLNAGIERPRPPVVGVLSVFFMHESLRHVLLEHTVHDDLFWISD